MRLGIMQPYFLPYVGYFQLLGAVDLFVVYDDVKYTKKGWINRNRYLLGGRDEVFTVPLESASDALAIRERRIAADFDPARLLARLREAYRRAPFFAPAFAFLERVVGCPERNLFDFLHHSIRECRAELGIGTPIVVSSTLAVEPGLKGAERVLALCEATGATHYINPAGGTALYDRGAFARRGVTLRFLEARDVVYEQLGAPFVPWLSIADVMMFNAPERIRGFLCDGYRLS